MQKNYESPECLFNLQLQPDGNYGIMNCQNYEYFQCTITTMVGKVTGTCQEWAFEPVSNVTNGYYIKNIANGEYMTNHATQLAKNPGSNEVYIVESRPAPTNA